MLQRSTIIHARMNIIIRSINFQGSILRNIFISDAEKWTFFKTFHLHLTHININYVARFRNSKKK